MAKSDVGSSVPMRAALKSRASVAPEDVSLGKKASCTIWGFSFEVEGSRGYCQLLRVRLVDGFVWVGVWNVTRSRTECFKGLLRTLNPKP